MLFLGPVDATRVPELTSIIDSAALTREPYQARADHGDGRVRAGDGVAWLALSSGAGQLIALADTLSRTVPVGVTEGAPPRRTASAHLTVARKPDEALISALRSQELGRISVVWTIDRVALLRSHLSSDGARYETLHHCRLYAPGHERSR